MRTTASLVGSNLATSALGFAYWSVAARGFSTESVGIAAAAISLMLLLGRLALLGLGTSLVSELPRHGSRGAALIATALVAAAASGGVLGLFAVALAHLIAPEIGTFASSPELIVLFVSGVSLTAVAGVLDQALIGLMRGGIQLVRNLVFATTKLALLATLAYASLGGGGVAIYATWAAGNLASLAIVGVFSIRRGVVAQIVPREWRSLLGLSRVSLLHHVLNVTRFAPTLALPVVVAGLLSAHATAIFYVALLVAGAIYLVSASATFTLFAIGARSTDELASQLRFTGAISLGVALAGNVLVLVAGGPVLSLFGGRYSSEALPSLLILALAAFPTSLKDHWIAVQRIRGTVGWAALVSTVGATLELASAVVGAVLGGLEGLSAGWLAALTLEAILLAPTVVRAALASPSADPPGPSRV